MPRISLDARRIRLFLSALLLSAPAVAVAEATSEESLVAPEMIRVEGHEVTHGRGLCCPRFLQADHALVVTATGELHHTILIRDESTPAVHPPRATVAVSQLTRAELRKLQRLLTEARIGQQRDCGSPLSLSFVFFESSTVPKERVTWSGPGGRRRVFEAWHGQPCSPEVQSLLGYLSSLAYRARTATR